MVNSPNVCRYNLNFISSAFPPQIYLTQRLLVQSIPLLIPVVIELKCALKSHRWPAVPVDLWMPSSDSQIRRSVMAPECAWLSTPVVLMHAEKHWLVLWKLGCTSSLTKLPLPCQYPDWFCLLANNLIMELSFELCRSEKWRKFHVHQISRSSNYTHGDPVIILLQFYTLVFTQRQNPVT